MTPEITIPDETIISKIYLFRGQKVMLDSDLAELYGVETKTFNQAVKRNLDRFPEDFMFQLTSDEFENLRSQSVTSSWGGRRYPPKVFTEQGVAMLSSVLNSSTAIQVNIKIIRIFTRLREMLLTHKDILLKLEQMESQVLQNSDDIQMIFSALKQLVDPANPPRRRIGFNVKDKE
jgi:hypothetical protein